VTNRIKLGILHFLKTSDRPLDEQKQVQRIGKWRITRQGVYIYLVFSDLEKTYFNLVYYIKEILDYSKELIA
jgi:hypothetical protein